MLMPQTGLLEQAKKRFGQMGQMGQPKPQPTAGVQPMAGVQTQTAPDMPKPMAMSQPGVKPMAGLGQQVAAPTPAAPMAGVAGVAGVTQAPAINTSAAPTPTPNASWSFNAATKQPELKSATGELVGYSGDGYTADDSTKRGAMEQYYTANGGQAGGFDKWYADYSREMPTYTMDNKAPGDDAVELGPDGTYRPKGLGEDPAKLARVNAEMDYMNQEWAKGNKNAVGSELPQSPMMTGVGAVAGKPASGAPAALPGGVPSVPGAAASGDAFANPRQRFAQLSQIDPNADLRGMQIAPEPTDRFGAAKMRFDALKSQLEKDLVAKQRGVTQSAAAGGRLGSGMLRTDHGNLLDSFATNLGDSGNRFLADALDSQIGDERGYRDELRGERDYQVGSEDRAYGRTRDRYLLEEAAKDRDFGRNLSRATFAYGGNPSSTLTSAGRFGQDSASQTSDGVMALLKAMGQKGASLPAGTSSGTSGLQPLADVVKQIDWRKLLPKEA